MLLKCSWKFSFWVIEWVTMLLLKISDGWDDFWILGEKGTSWACLLGSGLKFIFHWKDQLFILFKSSFKVFVDKFLSNITEKRAVSSTNSLEFETKFSDKSFIYILRKVAVRELNPEEPLLQHWPMVNFDHTLCFLCFRRLPKSLVSYPLRYFVLTYK